MLGGHQPLQSFQHTLVDVFQGLDVLKTDILIDLVNAGIGRTQLNDLRANLRNKAAIAGATRGRELCADAGLGQDGGLHRLAQLTGLGEKG